MTESSRKEGRLCGKELPDPDMGQVRGKELGDEKNEERWEIKLRKNERRRGLWVESKADSTSRRTRVQPLSKKDWAKGPRRDPILLGVNPNWVFPKSWGRKEEIEDKKKEERFLEESSLPRLGVGFEQRGAS